LKFIHEIVSPTLVISSIHRSSYCDDIARFSGKNVEKIGYEGEIYLKNKGKGPYNRIVTSYDRVKKPHSKKFNHVIFHELQFLNGISDTKFQVHQILPWLSPVRDLPVELNLGANYAVFIPGAGDFRRILPVKTQVELMKKILSETDLKCVLLGGKREKELARTIEQEIGNNKVVNLTGIVGLREAFSLISKAKFVFGMETGLTHAAWILEIPTVMVYGGGHFGRFLPLSSAGKVVFHRMSCFGCNWKCVYSETPFKCVSSISVSELIKALFSVMGRSLK